MTIAVGHDRDAIGHDRDAVGHNRDCYVQFEYSCKQLHHIEKFFKINIHPKE